MTGHDCSQGQTIGEITATIRYFQDVERRREGREERMAVAMETMAAQGESLKAIAERVTKTEKDTDGLFERVRELEIKPGEEGGQVKLGFWNALISAIVAVVVGLIITKR